MRLRIQMITLMLVAGGAAAWGTDTLIAQVPPAPVRTDLSQMRSAVSLDQQVAALQKEVAGLQSQVNALLAVVQVTNSGGAGQRPNVLITGSLIEVRSEMNTTVRTGGLLYVASSAGVDLRGSTIRLNGGTKPIATAGSPVQVQGNGGGVILNGSATVFAD